MRGGETTAPWRGVVELVSSAGTCSCLGVSSDELELLSSATELWSEFAVCVGSCGSRGCSAGTGIAASTIFAPIASGTERVPMGVGDSSLAPRPPTTALR